MKALNESFGLGWNFDGQMVNGQPIPEGTQVMFYAEFVNAGGTSTWFPPLSADGIPDTEGAHSEMHLTGEQAGLQAGNYQVYVHTIAVFPGADAPMISERSDPALPLSFWAPAAPDAPTDVALLD